MSRPAISFLFFVFCTGAALAMDPAVPLSEAEQAGVQRIDSMTVPTPGEVFAAIDKQGKPSWATFYRDPIPTNFTHRAQIALNLGGLVADGYIAVAAQDGQQVKNIGRDIIALAKALGVSQNVLARGNSITGFAENNEWHALHEELEATQNEVKRSMDEQQDQDLVALVTLGAWIRGTEVLSAAVVKDPSPGKAELLRQPALVGFLRGKLSGLNPKLTQDEFLRDVDRQLAEIETLVSFDRDTPPSPEAVEKLHAAAGALVADLAHRRTQ